MGLLAAILLSLDASLLTASRQAMLDIYAIFFSTMAVKFYIDRGQQNRDRFRGLLSPVSAGLAMGSKLVPSTFAVIPTLAIDRVKSLRAGKAIRPIVLVGGASLTFLLVNPVYWYDPALLVHFLDSLKARSSVASNTWGWYGFLTYFDPNIYYSWTHVYTFPEILLTSVGLVILSWKHAHGLTNENECLLINWFFITSVLSFFFFEWGRPLQRMAPIVILISSELITQGKSRVGRALAYGLGLFAVGAQLIGMIEYYPKFYVERWAAGFPIPWSPTAFWAYNAGFSAIFFGTLAFNIVLGIFTTFKSYRNRDAQV